MSGETNCPECEFREPSASVALARSDATPRNRAALTQMTDWNSKLYLKFERERTRAARDLIAHIPDFSPRGVFDLGCGPGNSTELLTARFPDASVVGIDLSDEMLDVARARVSEAAFVKDDIATWRPREPAGLIFANAALHFVTDHRARLLELVSDLSDGGILAVQMPDNIHDVSHALMRMVAADGPWANRLVPIAKTRVLVGGLVEYYELLSRKCAKLDIWHTTYVHALDGVDDIVDWFEGSALRPFLEALNADEREAFLARYRLELDAAYPSQSDGKVLLRYPRLFLVARK